MVRKWSNIFYKNGLQPVGQVMLLSKLNRIKLSIGNKNKVYYYIRSNRGDTPVLGCVYQPKIV